MVAGFASRRAVRGRGGASTAAQDRAAWLPGECRDGDCDRSRSWFPATAPPRQPLRLDRAPQPARLPRARRLRGDGASASARGRRFFYVALEGQSPSRFTNGRVARLEEQFVELTGAPMRLDTFEDPERSWEAARAAVDEGRPAILLTDLYYLDHYGTLGPLPGPRGGAGRLRRRGRLPVGHRVRGAADDDGSRTWPGRATASTRRFPLDGHMCTCPTAPRSPSSQRRPPARDRGETPGEMLDPPLGEYEGLPALRRFAAEVGEWPRAARGLAVVRALLLPGDRAPGHRRRQLQAHVLPLPRGGGVRAGRPRRRRRPSCGRRSPAGPATRASPTSARPEDWERIAAEAERVLAVERALWSALADQSSG